MLTAPCVRHLCLFFALLAGCTGAISDPPSAPGGPSPSDPRAPGTEVGPFAPGPATMPRLTQVQYANAVADLFGAGLPRISLEADQNPHLFFNIGAASTTLSEYGAQRYADSADAITEALFTDVTRRVDLLGCVPTSGADGCVEPALADLGRRIYRRPLTDGELSRWLSVSEQAGATDPWDGPRFAIWGMLQSPNFLYRSNVGEPDPADPSRRRYTSWEMAERLSFFFWNTTPDAELLDAAERGELLDDASLYDQAMRLAEDTRTRAAVQDFFAQYLDLGGLASVERTAERYPEWSETMASSMEMELRLLVDDIVFRRDGDLRELFSTRRTFVNSELATLYGVSAPDASPIAFVPVELPSDGPRAGILTLGAFLAMNAHESETSPTKRGKYVRERVLCQSVPPPPDNVNLDLTQSEGETTTLRERLEEHRQNPACASCHSFIDPPGFLFESFDSIGRFRTEVDGYAVDTSGDLDGTPLADATDLATALHDDPRVPACIVRQLFRHANARLETDSEEAALVELEAAFADSGYRFRDLMVALAMSEGFRTVSDSEGSR